LRQFIPIHHKSIYAKNAKRTQKLVLNKPVTAEERLQRSIRFLELSGGKLPELLSESRNMSTIALYNLDIAFLAALATFTLLALLAILARFAWRLGGKAAAELAWTAISTNIKRAGQGEEKMGKIE
jgi:hypothetical protein